MKPVYLLSGLGADKRVFDYLKLDDVELIHIEWVPPEMSESIEAYVKRICKQILTDKPILIGVSFGGIIATEIAKLIDCKKIILISSAATKDDIPLLYRVAGQLRIHKLIPTSLFIRVNAINGGGHFMIVNKASEISGILNDIFS